MTTPESDEHFEHRAGLYMRELARLEQAGERTTVAFGPLTAMMLIGWVQMVTRHPRTSRTELEMAKTFIRQLEPLFEGTVGEEIIRRGNHADFDK